MKVNDEALSSDITVLVEFATATFLLGHWSMYQAKFQDMKEIAIGIVVNTIASWTRLVTGDHVYEKARVRVCSIDRRVVAHGTDNQDENKSSSSRTEISRM